jgi:hypothetical protein
MEASSKVVPTGPPEKSPEGEVAIGAQLLADAFKKQVRKKLIE